MKEKLISIKNKGKYCYVEYGNNRGFPLFFFHGWPGSRLQAEAFNNIANKLNIRLISMDRPGYGLSDYDSHRQLLDFPNMVVDIAAHIGVDKFSVLGQSGGGPYAAVCAFAMPERIHKAGISAGLAPTNVPGILKGMSWYSRLVWTMYNKLPILMQLNSFGFNLRTKLLPNSLIGTFGSNVDNKILDQKTRRELINNRKEAFRQGIKGVARDLKLYTQDWGFDLKKIKSKVYLYYGKEDKNVSIEMGRYYKKQIPNSILKVYPDVGHLLLRRYAEEIFNELTT